MKKLLKYLRGDLNGVSIIWPKPNDRAEGALHVSMFLLYYTMIVNLISFNLNYLYHITDQKECLIIATIPSTAKIYCT